jgi:hypothetical protein
VEDPELEDLFAEIGSQLVAANAGKYNAKQLAEIGRRWLTSNYERIQIAVCTSPRVRSAYEQDSSNPQNKELVAALADVIATLTLGVAPALVSLILIRKGITALCSSRWV